jgi:mevalonate kinase
MTVAPRTLTAAASACGKVILSGEHAVVHGSPALVIPVSQRIGCRLKQTEERHLTIHLPDLDQVFTRPLSSLPQLVTDLAQRHAAFIAGEQDVSAIIQEPAELVAAAFETARHHCEGAACGAALTLESALPLGSGLGSSAAAIISVLRVVCQWYGLTPTAANLYEWALDLERYQHGTPSGIDPCVIAHEQPMLFRKQEAPKSLTLPPFKPVLVMTGQPESTTGECVAHVTQFAADATRWRRFQAVTLQMKSALEQDDHKALHRAIRTNHALLCELGVVPAPVQAFIQTIEDRGGSAKICGAGAVRGSAAGITCVYGIDPVEPCSAHNYRLLV